MSPRKLVAQLPSDDKTIPAPGSGYFGQLEPNYWCRAWNEKRQKYCKLRAGAKTDHVGVGRCKFHGGRNQNAGAMKHGKRSKIGRPELRQAILEAAKEENPLDMLPTLAKAKGILNHAIAEYAKAEGSDVALADLNKSVDTVSKVVYRIEQQRGMIAKDRVRLFMEQLYDLLDTVPDEKLRKRLIQGVDAIRA